MSGIARKVLRNQLKAELKRTGTKRTMPLSKYRFKTQEEMNNERAEKLTEQMLQTMKKSEAHSNTNK